ncbi:cupin domain-containing protein [Neolewinella persica]|uniref:cupin domain-containing protein n=1 Tax=Neolewinella persica TaxID=70998 RepID=UPI0003700B6C|nr:cupin domain-containing protein [Neolewinella persica]
MRTREIPTVSLKLKPHETKFPYVRSVMDGEIEGAYIEHVTIDNNGIADLQSEDCKTIYLFFRGQGTIVANNLDYEIVPETIFLPNEIKSIKIEAEGESKLHYLKISSKLTDQDKMELEKFPSENTQSVYYAKFSDCQSYVEPIKSPNTVSRTILPNKIIPRVAMGTVQTKGPDEVGAHQHPMLEQLFLGLSKNSCVVYADNAKVNFPEHALLHIPLGSRHSVSVNEGENLHYVWMDFFLDSKGEEWLKTHIVEDKDTNHGIL